MLEKEIKILDVDVPDLIKKLNSFGAKKIFEGYIHDIYYDFPGHNGNKMDIQKRIFRVRKKGDIHMYTIKRKRNKIKQGGENGIKVADEAERIITDVESFTKVLDKYGMKQIREKKKYRISYELGDVFFDIDDYFYKNDRNLIPPLLEIESDNSLIIKYWITKLGFKNHSQKKFGSRKLFKFYGVDYDFL